MKTEHIIFEVKTSFLHYVTMTIDKVFKLDMRHIQYQGETLPLPPGISVSPGIR